MKAILKSIFVLLILANAAIAFAALPEITQFNYNPSPAVPGSTIAVLVQVENKDSFTQNGVGVLAENSYPFTIKPTDERPNPKNLGDIKGFGEALAQFTVYVDPTAENKTYSLPVTVTTQQNPNGKKVNFDVIIGGKEPIVKVVSVQEQKLLPGEEKEITLELQNIGTSPAYDVLVEMLEDRTVTATGTVVEREITPLGAASAYVASINPGETKEAKLTVSVSNTAAIKNYTLPVNISYRNSSGDRVSEKSYIGLNVFGTADIDATLKEQLADTITVEVFNKGLGKAEFTLVELSTPDGTIENPKQFIGTLGPNDVDTAKTKISFNTTGNHVVDVKISYVDADAQNKTTTIQIPVKAVQSSQEGPNWALIIIILAVIGYGVWRFVLKKGKK